MKKSLCLLAIVCFMAQLSAQIRYQDDIFLRSEVVVSSDVEFGQNYYFLNYPPAPTGTSASNPQIGPLLMDVYTPPVSDTAQARPVIMLIHTGSFLPRFINGFPTGRKDDSTMVELAYRFTQKGYVVAVPDYRLGWNPIASTQVERTRQILNAVYRAIHDAQTCVRYFKKDEATTNNYKIDPKRIIIIGSGSGGYISLAYNFLDKQEETALPKFLDGLGSSVIDPSLVGYVDGVGGLYNNYEHGGYSNQVAMVANFGGALGDISWMDQTYPTVPVAGMHCTKDLYSPIDSGNVVVPSTGDIVVFVHGTRTAVRRAVAQGLNDIWLSQSFTDPYSTRAYSLNASVQNEGFFEFLIPDIPSSTEQESAPWEWWDSTAATTAAFNEGAVFWSSVHSNGVESNPGMSKAKAVAYIDTIVGFFTPRMYYVLQDQTIGLEESPVVNYSIYPNPSSDLVMIKLDAPDIMKSIQVFTMTGKVALSIPKVNSSNYTLNCESLAPGTYILSGTSNVGVFNHRIVIK